MASMSRVVALVLGQVGGEIGKGLAEGVAGHFDDPGQVLPEAIRRAYGRAWQVIELALAGEELGGRLRLALASGEVRGVVAPVGRILAARGPEMRSACLREIKEARDHGALEPDLAVPTQESPLQRLEDPQGFLEAAWGAVRDLAVGLHRAGYVNLAQLVGTRMAGQPPLLVTAFGYFLRREVADDPRLAAGLNFDLLQRLWQGQEAGFGRLGEDTWPAGAGPCRRGSSRSAGPWPRWMPRSGRPARRCWTCAAWPRRPRGRHGPWQARF